ncbi:phosphodiester glycosidase family protein [Symmachiella macrocystis]|nr:phosphodiester glycosidase family protein [Symmachiella macrocystis]
MRSSRFRTFCYGLLLFGVSPFVILGTFQAFYRFGPRPVPGTTPLFHGVDYIRIVLDEPTPAVVHILKVDLKADGVEVFVTPPEYADGVFAVEPRTTSQFLSEFGLQAAINGSHFSPFERRNPLSYIPYWSDPKDVLGGAASRWAQYGTPKHWCPVLHIDESGHGTIARSLERPWYTATAGTRHFIVEGEPSSVDSGPFDAMTAAGLDAEGRTLFLVVVDGDQLPYSEGIDQIGLASLLLDQGVYNAIRLDGGGSSTMLSQGTFGIPIRLNRPVQGGFLGIERPVGNHIGVFAKPLAFSGPP